MAKFIVDTTDNKISRSMLELILEEHLDYNVYIKELNEVAKYDLFPMALSIEQMENLESLGLDTSNASMAYVTRRIFSDLTKQYLLPIRTIGDQESVINHLDQSSFAYTLQDVLQMILPLKLKDQEYFAVMPNGCVTIMRCSFEGDYEVRSFDGGLLDSAYGALVWSIENGFKDGYNIGFKRGMQS